MAQLKKTTLLKESTVARRLICIAKKRRTEAQRHIEAMANLEIEKRNVQARCPHTKTWSSYGQYLKSVDYCELCGAEVS
jgi:hypothetical protein